MLNHQLMIYNDALVIESATPALESSAWEQLVC